MDILRGKHERPKLTWEVKYLIITIIMEYLYIIVKLPPAQKDTGLGWFTGNSSNSKEQKIMLFILEPRKRTVGDRHRPFFLSSFLCFSEIHTEHVLL